MGSTRQMQEMALEVTHPQGKERRKVFRRVQNFICCLYISIELIIFLNFFCDFTYGVFS